jgi:hypothetical protein
MMAHVHQHEGVQTVAPGRFALAAAYKLPLLTETLADPGIIPGHALLRSDLAHYADLAQIWLRQRHGLEDIGRALYHVLCERHTFHGCVEAAL